MCCCNLTVMASLLIISSEATIRGSLSLCTKLLHSLNMKPGLIQQYLSNSNNKRAVNKRKVSQRVVEVSAQEQAKISATTTGADPLDGKRSKEGQALAVLDFPSERTGIADIAMPLLPRDASNHSNEEGNRANGSLLGRNRPGRIFPSFKPKTTWKDG
jgi:hypothetical protein